MKNQEKYSIRDIHWLRLFGFVFLHALAAYAVVGMIRTGLGLPFPTGIMAHVGGVMVGSVMGTCAVVAVIFIAREDSNKQKALEEKIASFPLEKS